MGIRLLEIERERERAWGSPLAQLRARRGFPQTGRILELGSGTGALTRSIAQAGYDVVGVETSDVVVQKAKEQTDASLAQKITYVHGSAAQLGSLDLGQFDAVIAGNCLHFIVGEDREKTLNAVAASLKPEGVFYVNTLCGDPKDEKLRANFNWTIRSEMLNGKPSRYLGQPASIARELRAAGFVLRDTLIKSELECDRMEVIAFKTKAQ